MAKFYKVPNQSIDNMQNKQYLRFKTYLKCVSKLKSFKTRLVYSFTMLQ